MFIPRTFFPRKALALLLAGGLSIFVLSPALSDEGAATQTETRGWTGTHGALAGPMLDAAWFEHRKAIVYLLPQGADLSSIRVAASQIMQEEWIAGRHEIKHIFISNVSGRVRFAARQRIAVRDITEQVTIQAGQDLEYAAQNMPFVRNQVYFVWDPDAKLWSELIGPDAAGAPQLKILLLDHGNVARSIDPTKIDPNPELGELPEFVVTVRKTFDG